MPIGSTNVYNPGDLILSTVSGSGTSFIETKIIAATSSFILFNSSGTLTSASLNSIVATTSSYVSGSTSIITNLTASNISASGTGSFGMVGIGTTLPSAKLHVVGSSILSNNATINPDSYTGIVAGNIADGSGWGALGIGGNNGNTGRSFGMGVSGTTFYMGFQNGSTTSSLQTFLAVSGSRNLFLVPDGGNVGIGTTSPSYRLQLGSLAGSPTSTPETINLGGTYSNTAGSNIKLRVYDDVSSSGGMSVSSGQMEVNTWATGKIAFYRGTTQSAIIDANGNVGIGTTSPDAILTIKSSSPGPYGIGTPDFAIAGNAGGNLTSLQIYRGANTGSYIGIDAFRSGISGTHLVLNAANNGNVGIGTTAPGARLEISSSTAASLLNVKGAVGNGILFISGSGFVGIGTTAPVEKLDVRGGAIANGNGTIKTVLSYTTEGLVGTLSNHALLLYTNNTEQVRITSGGNVGIGTTSPTARLHVSGSTGGVFEVDTLGGATSFYVSASGNIGIGTSTSILGKLQLDSGAAPYYGPATSSATPNGMFTLGSVLGDVVNTFGVDASATAYAWIQPRKITVASYSNLVLNPNGGNVGIGTTLPASKFHISGSGQTIMRLDSDTTSSVSQFQIKAASDAVLIMGMLGGSAASTNFGVTAAGQAYFGTSTLGSPHPTSLVIGNVSNIPIAFSTNNVERMRIDGVGNVGIGTTSATNKLEVIGGTNTRINLGNIDDVNRGGKLEIISGSATARQFYVGTNSAIYNLVFGIDSIEKMRIDTAGNVGIGTTSPAAKLDVVSSPTAIGTIIRVRDTVTLGTGSFAGIHFTSSPGTDYTIGKLTTAAGAGLLQIRDQSGNQFVTVDSGGNVGIGTTSPADKLSVISGSVRIASTALAGALYFGNDTSNIYLQRDNSYDLSLVQNGDSNSALYLASAGSVYVNIDSNNNDTDKAFIVQNNALKAGTELFRVQENGNVGIGTTVPTAFVDIQGANVLSFGGSNTGSLGTIFLAGTDEYNSGTAGAGIYFRGKFNSAGTTRTTFGAISGIKENNTDGDFSGALTFFARSGSNTGIIHERMRIGSSGNVGIGTTNPTARLHVSGSTIITGSLNVSANITCLSLTETSTEAVKYNILPLPSQLDNVLKLKPVSFNYKANDKHSIGLIAEEVAKIYPEFTSDNNDSISYGKITSVLIQSIKELKTIIDNQQKQIENLIDKLK